MRLLLISNSTNPGELYLDYPRNNIREFLGSKSVKTLFRLSGSGNIRIFRKGSAPLEFGPESDISFLLKQKN